MVGIVVKGIEPIAKFFLEDVCEITEYDTCARIRFPAFFPKSGYPLELLLAEHDGSVTVSDCGSAYRELSAKTSDPYILSDTFAYLMGSFLNILPSESNEIIWKVSSSYLSRFHLFFQCICFCAHADLYPGVDEDRLRECRPYIKGTVFPLNKHYPEAFLEAWKQSVWREDDRIQLAFYFSDEMAPMGILIECEQERCITITDVGDFDGGDLIERLKWYHRENYHQCDPLIRKVCARFGAEYDGEKIRYTFQNEDGLSLPKAVLTFMQLMSILAELGITIRPNGMKFN